MDTIITVIAATDWNLFWTGITVLFCALVGFTVERTISILCGEGR